MIAQRIIRPREVPHPAGDLPGDIHPVIQRVLLARGVSSADELSLGLKDMLLPDGLGGVVRAAGLLADAVTQGQRVLVVGDFDADGATGTALAILSLRAMGCENVGFRVPNRFEFGYGLTAPLVETLADDPPDLLITVDSGISCIDGVDAARKLGCAVIVTDHHLPGERLPSADAIVNPNCEGDAFPSKAAAGVGVMFYLLSVVRRELRSRGWFGVSRPEPNLAAFLKRDYRFAHASDLGFAVGPRLNAAGRLEDMGTGIRCLISDDPSQAAVLARELDELNHQRRGMQDQMQEQALGQVRELLASMKREKLPPAICLFDESWHQGIVGLVASRVKDSVHRPVIAFAPEAEGSGVLKGSARSVKGLHIRDVLAHVDSHAPGLIRAFGGHAMAAGLTMEAGAYAQFEQALEVAVVTILDGARLDAEILTDGELAGHEINLDLAVGLERHGPWGQRFPEPLFDGRFNVLEKRVVGTSHLKMVVQAVDGGEAVDAIAFNKTPEDLPATGPARMLYRLGVNRWRGSESCQLIVEEILK
jgi:single-stranded-DNA-specific exonuclease